MLAFKDVTQSVSDFETYLTQRIAKPSQWSMQDYMNRVKFMFGLKKYFPPPVEEDQLLPTLLQQSQKWHGLETYRVGTQLLRKAQLTGLSESATKFLNEYRWKSSRTYADPNSVTDSELMTALNAYEAKREQDFKERSDRKMSKKRKSSRSRESESRSRTRPKYRDRSSNSPPAKRKKPKKFCQVCKDADKPYRIYTNHNTEECHFGPKSKSHKKASRKDYKKKEARRADYSSPSSDAASSSSEESEREANVMRRARKRKPSNKSARRARSRAASRKRARSASTADSQSVISIPDDESEDSWMAAQRRVDERNRREAEAEEEDKNSRFYESPDSHE